MNEKNGTVKIGEIQFERYPKDGEKIQEFVKRTLGTLFKHNLIPQKEIEKLLDKDYSKKTFNLDYALLADSTVKHYWSETHFDKHYYCCFEWYNVGGAKGNEERAKKQREGFAKWLETLAK